MLFIAKPTAILHGVPVTAQNADIFVPPTGAEEKPVNEAEAGRRIAALKAIVQTMLPDHYPRGHAKDGKALFAEQLAEDELLAMAVANELSENELEHAFAWIDASYGAIDNELAASPVRPHLSDEQVQRARVALLAIAEVDDAHTLAVRMPDRPGEPPLTADERVRMGEEVFVGRIEIDVLHEHEGWSGFTTRAAGNLEKRIDSLPEPWRQRVKGILPELRSRLRETLERESEAGPGSGNRDC